jgi:hypothetical protein
MRILTALFPVLLLSATLAWAEGPQVSANCLLQWQAPTTNADGTPLTDLAKYRLYLSQSKGLYGAPAADVIQPTTQIECAKVGAVALGQYYAVTTAMDFAGNESARSNEAPFEIVDKLPPGAPGGLTIIEIPGAPPVTIRRVPQY